MTNINPLDTARPYAPPTPPPCVDELRRQIDGLQLRLNEAQFQVGNLRRGAEIVAGALRDEAIDRDWCDDFDEFVEQVNGRLPAGVPRLTGCERDYYVHFHVTVRESVVSELESQIDQLLPAGVVTESFDYELV